MSYARIDLDMPLEEALPGRRGQWPYQADWVDASGTLRRTSLKAPQTLSPNPYYLRRDRQGRAATTARCGLGPMAAPAGSRRVANRSRLALAVALEGGGWEDSRTTDIRSGRPRQDGSRQDPVSEDLVWVGGEQACVCQCVRSFSGL